jgi:putative membrane protein
MGAFLIRVLVFSVAVWVAAWIVPGIDLVSGDDVVEQVLTAGAVGLVFAALDTVVRPILFFLSLPLIVLTLGLFIFVLNAVMLWFTAWISQQLGLEFIVQEFWWDAILGALVITVVSMILNLLLPDGRD